MNTHIQNIRKKNTKRNKTLLYDYRAVLDNINVRQFRLCCIINNKGESTHAYSYVDVARLIDVDSVTAARGLTSRES